MRASMNTDNAIEVEKWETSNAGNGMLYVTVNDINTFNEIMWRMENSSIITFKKTKKFELRYTGISTERVKVFLKLDGEFE